MIVRCKYERNGHICNNIICEQEQGKVIVKRKGRTIIFHLAENGTAEIKCEKCKNITIISGKN